MNWPEVSTIISALTLLIVLVGGGVLWGALTEKVSGHTKRLDSHGGQIGALDVRVNGHDVEIAKLVEWKAGYNAAASVGRHTPEV
jgi:hypothetical protein